MPPASSKTRPVTAGARVILPLTAILSLMSAGHRGRKADPLYPGPQSFARLAHTGSPHAKRNASVRPSRQMRRISVSKSPTFTGQVREVFQQAAPTQGRRLAAHLIERLPACPIPEIARLGPNPTQLEGRTRRLLRHRRSKQRLHGSHQRTLSS